MSGALQALFQNWRSFTAPAPAPAPASVALYSGGNNSNGQLGLGDTTNRSAPNRIGSGTTWASIAAGNAHTLAVKTDGTLWSWGFPNHGQLGINIAHPEPGRSSPVQVGALTNWLSVSAGPYGNFSMAIKTDGTLWAWGRNSAGSGAPLGDGTTISRSSPVQIGALTTWLSVSAGRYTTLAIKTDGSLWGWGNGGYIGDAPLFSYRSSPVQVGNQTTDWASCSSRSTGGFGIKTNGQLWTWGHDYSGVNGLNNAINQLSPIQVGALTTWSKIATGTAHVLAIKTDGTLWSWGSNQEGRLGQNIATTTYRSSPVQVGALTTWSKIAAGATGGHSMAIKTDGTLWAWGKNDVGQLMLGDTINRSSPVQVGALTNWLNLPDHLNHSVVTKTP